MIIGNGYKWVSSVSSKIGGDGRGSSHMRLSNKSITHNNLEGCVAKVEARLMSN